MRPSLVQPDQRFCIAWPERPRTGRVQSKGKGICQGRREDVDVPIEADYKSSHPTKLRVITAGHPVVYNQWRNNRGISGQGAVSSSSHAGIRVRPSVSRSCGLLPGPLADHHSILA